MNESYSNLFVKSLFAAGIFVSMMGAAWTQVEVSATSDEPPAEAPSEASRFPAVEIAAIFEPPGESNVRSSIRLAEGIALIGTEETGDVYKTLDSGATWSKVTDGGDEWEIQDVRNFIRAQDGHLYATTSEPALVLQSMDEGESWEVLARPESSRTVGIVQLDDGAILVGLRRSKNDRTSIVRSTDYFKTMDWIVVSENEPRQNVTCFQNLGGPNVLAGVGYEGSGKVYKSEDSGETWRKTGEFDEARDIMAFYREGEEVYVMASGIATLFMSADAGESWSTAHQFWAKGFVGSTATFDWNGKSYRLIPGTDQTGSPPRHSVWISDDQSETWTEWAQLGEPLGGGANNLAVIADDTVIVGVGNHAVQGRCYTLRFE